MIIQQDGELIHKDDTFKELDLKYPADVYAILVLREDFNWTWRQIAAHFKCSEATISYKLKNYV